MPLTTFLRNVGKYQSTGSRIPEGFILHLFLHELVQAFFVTKHEQPKNFLNSNILYIPRNTIYTKLRKLTPTLFMATHYRLDSLGERIPVG